MSAVIPVLMSLAAPGIVLDHIVFLGGARQADEVLEAHLQAPKAGQLPIIGYFAITAIPKDPLRAVGVLGVQVGMALAAVAPVFALNFQASSPPQDLRLIDRAASAADRVAELQGMMPMASDPIVWGLLLAALLDSADLYLRLIRRRASRRRMVSEQDDAVLRSLVRVFLVDHQAILNMVPARVGEFLPALLVTGVIGLAVVVLAWYLLDRIDRSP